MERVRRGVEDLSLIGRPGVRRALLGWETLRSVSERQAEWEVYGAGTYTTKLGLPAGGLPHRSAVPPSGVPKCGPLSGYASGVAGLLGRTTTIRSDHFAAGTKTTSASPRRASARYLSEGRGSTRYAQPWQIRVGDCGGRQTNGAARRRTIACRRAHYQVGSDRAKTGFALYCGKCRLPGQNRPRRAPRLPLTRE